MSKRRWGNKTKVSALLFLCSLLVVPQLNADDLADLEANCKACSNRWRCFKTVFKKPSTRKRVNKLRQPQRRPSSKPKRQNRWNTVLFLNENPENGSRFIPEAANLLQAR